MFRQIFILTFLVFFYVTAFSQTGSRNVFKVLNRIKSVPVWYSPQWFASKIDYNSKQKFKGVDSTYAVIAKMDTNAIIPLINFLPDTALTNIPNTCQGGFLTFGQLAFFLINDIEHIPVFMVTKSQWDSFGECGLAPDGFLEYLTSNGRDFEELYRKWFNSKERQEYLREKRKSTKQIG
jgi:hypothetical protein